MVDAKTGKILFANAADAKRFPASLTKMMTLYLLFEALDEGRTGLNARITISAHAAAQQPTKLGIRPGGTISVRDAILALVTRSANDIAVAIGEYLAGSERAFAAQMTAKARALGMNGTTFRNASGLPDSGQVTTARDMATLGMALREHYPQYYGFFSTTAFVWDGERIRGHNPLLSEFDGVDGIKTGYTNASGYNLVTSVKRDGRELVAVVIGGETASWRDDYMLDLVKQYLPKASAGVRTAAVIPGGPAAIQVATPRLRPTDDNTAVAAAPTAVIDDLNPTEIGEGDVASNSEPATAPTTATGWKIQLAAAPTRAGAEEVLDHALSTAQKLLASATPYTEPVTVKGATMYRARFSGFADQQAAKDACAALAKQKFACLPINN